MIEKPKFFRGNIYKDKRGDLSEIYKKVNNVKQVSRFRDNYNKMNIYQGLDLQECEKDIYNNCAKKDLCQNVGDDDNVDNRLDAD